MIKKWIKWVQNKGEWIYLKETNNEYEPEKIARKSGMRGMMREEETDA